MDDLNVTWADGVEEKFEKMVAKVPPFLREMAKGQVLKKARSLVKDDGRSVIEEKDMVDAFFSITPFGFHGPMKSDMEELGIDYTQYGH